MGRAAVGNLCPHIILLGKQRLHEEVFVWRRGTREQVHPWISLPQEARVSYCKIAPDPGIEVVNAFPPLAFTLQTSFGNEKIRGPWITKSFPSEMLLPDCKLWLPPEPDNKEKRAATAPRAAILPGCMNAVAPEVNANFPLLPWSITAAAEL